MKIISWNVNGLRSACEKGFLDWIFKENADIVCLQEIKAHSSQLDNNLTNIPNYNFYLNEAQRPGYSGVAVYTKKKPQKLLRNFDFERFDSEGRFLRLDFEDCILINIYLPHGGREKQKLEYKLEVYNRLIDYLNPLKDNNVILVGDFNVAHKEIDLARPKQNVKNIMFTPEEREKLDKILSLRFVDTFRVFNKTNGNYTWWSYMANVNKPKNCSWIEARITERNRNLGWRLDYIFVSKSLGPKLKKAFISPEVFCSDHCTVGIDIDTR